LESAPHDMIWLKAIRHEPDDTNIFVVVIAAVVVAVVAVVAIAVAVAVGC